MLANRRRNRTGRWDEMSPRANHIDARVDVLVRFTIWSSSGASVFAIDAMTKASSHPIVAYNHAHTPAVVLLFVGFLLCALGLLYSNILALGAGLMFGGLLGNGGELIRYGYASDWIHVGHYLTNVADIAGALGLLCCFAGYLAPRRLR